MADNPLGFSFQPGQQSIGVGGGVRQSGGPQSAVQIKSFTLPNRFVPGQIAPQALLQSPGGGGQLDVDILRRLMQAFAPQGQQPGVPSLAPPPLNHGQAAAGSGLPSGSLGSLYGGIFGAPPPATPQSTPQGGAPPTPKFTPGITPEPISAPPPAPPVPPPYEPAQETLTAGQRKRAGGGLFD